MITHELTNGRLTMEQQEDESIGVPAAMESQREETADGVPAEEAQALQPEADAPLDHEEVKAMLEALLFVSHDPLSFEKLAGILDDVPKPLLKTILSGLQADYDQPGRGLQIVEVAGGYQCVTRPEYSGVLKRLMKGKTTSKLSRSALETLAIIGYKQPMTRADIERIRGVETSGVLRTLLDQKLVRIVGRQDVPGRPILYGTSKQFLQRFGLRDLRDLPPLKEIKELGNPEQGSLDFLTEGDLEEGAKIKDLSA